MNPAPGDFTVGGWLVQPLAGEVRRGEEVVHLEPKVMALLVVLAQNAGNVLSRKELTEAVWPDTFVEDHAVTRAISELRSVLGWQKEDALETIPKRGYRLTLPVHAARDNRVAVPARPARPHPWRKSILLVGAGVLACLTIVVLVRPEFLRIFGSRQRMMLAVLPFENLTGFPDQEFVSDGLTEELITRLGALEPERLGIIARTSSFTYKNSKKRSDQIARELGVDYLIEGSVRQDGDRVRVAVQLITTRDQTHVWAQGYDDDRGHLLRLHDRVADAVTREIVARIVPGASVRTARSMATEEAHAAYLKGRYALTRGSGVAALSACDLFDQATAREPGYAPAWAGLATAHMMVANYSVKPPSEVRPKAKAAVDKALELEPSLVEARLALAGLKFEAEWDFGGAEREFRRAVADAPNSAQAHQWYAALLESLGRFGEAIEEMTQAHALDPASPRVGVDLGRAYYFAGRHEQAVAEYRKVIAVDSNYSGAHTMLGLALLELHRYSEGVTELEQAVALLRTRDRYSSYLGYAYAVAGRRPDAEETLSTQAAKWSSEHVGAWGIALTHLGLGNRDEAFAWLAKAYESREPAMSMLKAFPYWDSIRADPRFRSLLQRVGLPS